MKVTSAEVKRVLAGYESMLIGIADARNTVIDEIRTENLRYEEEKSVLSVYTSAYAVPDVPSSVTNVTSDPTYRKARRRIDAEEEHRLYELSQMELLSQYNGREAHIRRIRHVYDRMLFLFPRHHAAARCVYIEGYGHTEARHELRCSSFALREMLSLITHAVADVCNTECATEEINMMETDEFARLVRHTIYRYYNRIADREKEMEIMIVGIDHGYGFMKTRNSIFPSGVVKFDHEPPFTKRLVEIDGVYYQAGVQPDGLASDKTATEDYYILTLAAIAEELKARGQTGGYITLAIGVPLTRYGHEKNDLENYLTQQKQITYKYEGVEYKILDIPHIYTYPQGYSAIVNRLADIKGACYLIDIGTGTTDVLPVTSEKTMDLSKARTIQQGISNCISMVNEALSREFSMELSSDVIIDIMTGREAVISPRVRTVCESAITDWCDVLLKTLHANKINYEYTQTFFCGGGAGVLKKYAKNLDTENGCMTFITDIRANAVGYEQLATAQTGVNSRKGS